MKTLLIWTATTATATTTAFRSSIPPTMRSSSSSMINYQVLPEHHDPPNSTSSNTSTTATTLPTTSILQNLPVIVDPLSSSLVFSEASSSWDPTVPPTAAGDKLSPMMSAETNMWRIDAPLHVTDVRTSSLDSTTVNPARLFTNRHSASDYLYNISTLPQSSVLAEIRYPVLCVTLWSFALSVVHRILKECGRTQMAGVMCIPAGPHGLVAKVLGLLLVFKTNSAYGRFQEGRQIWERIHSQSRDLSRMLRLYEDCIGSERKRRMLKLLVSFPYLLRHHVCPRCLTEETVESSNPDDLIIVQDEIAPCDTRYDNSSNSRKKQQQKSQQLQITSSLDYMNVNSSTSIDVKCRSCIVDKRMLPWRLLSDGMTVTKKAFDSCLKSRNRPLWICDRLASEIGSIPLSDNSGLSFTSRERLALLGHVNKLSATIGQCERIHQTLVPVNYARHCLRSLTLWLMTLPLTMLEDFGLKTGLLMSIMAWLMFGVYQIGYSIEDPFQGSIRLSILCDNIRRDVLGDTYMRDTAFQLDTNENDFDNDLLLSNVRN